MVQKDITGLITRSAKRFLSLSLVLLFLLFLVRVYEVIFIFGLLHFRPGTWQLIIDGFVYDVIIYLRISALLLMPYILIALFSQKVARRFFIIIGVALVMGEVILLQYFKTSRVPLGADLFGYSIDEIVHTTGASGASSLFLYLFLILFFIYVVRKFSRHVYLKFKPWIALLLVMLMLSAWIPVKHFTPQAPRYTNEYSMYLATNKLEHFFRSSVNYYLNKGRIVNQSYTFKENSAVSDGSGFVYVDEEYPFLHKENTPDILGQYFELNDVAPNFVFIIVESLGRAYSGEEAANGSFTPFLDSLSSNGLYWENCLATSGRTFQVLPSLMASAPFGEKGFAELENNMPDHISLISLLKKQADYKSLFLYGGNAGFDNMDLFMQRQNIDLIIDEEDYSADYSKLPASGGFTWGYGDKEIYRRYLEEKSTSGTEPFLDVILTLAVHSPFSIPDQEAYIRKFEERLESLKIEERTKVFNRNYEKELSTVLYADDALRSFFNEFRSHPAFKNTIFVVTGDHRMPEIPISTQIDRFHVPLLVYSPMLKKAGRFSSLVTHFDVTPSFLALLDGSGFVDRPELAAWLGPGLDNSTSFRSRNSYVLMRNKNEIMDIIQGEDFYSMNTLYKLQDNLYIEPAENVFTERRIQDELINFLRKNNHVYTNNKLIPDSLKKWTFSSELN